MRKTAIILFLIQAGLAQSPVAPTPETAGPPNGENRDGYNIVNSLETGYRFATVGGNRAEYQSTVNFRDGVRLLSSSFSMNSRDGHGRFFDELVITTQGLGNDPYEYAMLRIQKNRLYRYDMSWRRNEYFNPGLTTDGAAGQHLLNTQYDMQDHDFTLYPDSNLKFFLGYTGTLQTGPALSSIQLFDSRGSIYPLFANVHRQRHEYRVGNEFRLLGVRVNWLHGWENFKEDTPLSLTNGGLPLTSTPGSPLLGYQSGQPYHGNSPYWRVAMFRDARKYSVNGRFTYTGGQRAFVVDENAIGLARFGAQQNQQILSLGDAKRPVATGNLNVSWLPASKVTVVNSTSVYSVRTQGSSELLQYNNSTQSSDLLYYEYLGVRTVSNETDLNYQALNWLGFSAAYQYSNRLIRSVEQVTVFGTPVLTPYEQTNQLHAGIFGLRLRPFKGLSVLLSGEIGRNDHPFTPIAGNNYHALNGKAQYKVKRFLLTASAQSDYRFTPVSLSAYSSESRTYSANGSWNPAEWFGIDAGYSRLHIYSLGAIAYFANSKLVTGDRSLYLSNINSVNFGARFNIRKRADLYLGYSRVEDVGDGRSSVLGSGIASASPVFEAVQTFPVAFDSPQARISVRLHERVRWNFGYQYYGYREKFYQTQNYRANTGYSSLTWSF